MYIKLENLAGAMGCFPHVHPGEHGTHPDVLGTQPKRSNERLKAAFDFSPVRSANSPLFNTIIENAESRMQEVSKYDPS
jgi:hypothetical protein